MSKPAIKEGKLKDNMEVIIKYNYETSQKRVEYIPDLDKSAKWDEHDRKGFPTKLSIRAKVKYLSTRTSVAEQVC